MRKTYPHFKIQMRAMISLNDWERERNKFTFPKTPDGNNCYTVDFFPKND